jgi:hypothetical protein
VRPIGSARDALDLYESDGAGRPLGVRAVDNENVGGKNPLDLSGQVFRGRAALKHHHSGKVEPGKLRRHADPGRVIRALPGPDSKHENGTARRGAALRLEAQEFFHSIDKRRGQLLSPKFLACRA